MWIVFASNASCWCVLFCRFFLVAFLVTCWERAGLLAVAFVVFCRFPKCVLVHIRIEGEFCAEKLVYANLQNFFTDGTFCESFVFFASCVSHAFASVHCCLVVTCWERLTSRLLLVMFIE